MKKLLFLALALLSATALAQGNMRVRGTISSLDGDVLSVKSRDGKNLKLHLTSDAQVAVAKKLSLSDIKPGTYVGVTGPFSYRPDGTALRALDIRTFKDGKGTLHLSAAQIEEQKVFAFGGAVK